MRMTELQDARNAIAHRRGMNEGEQHLAAGSLYWFEQCLRAATRDEETDENLAEVAEETLVGEN